MSTLTKVLIVLVTLFSLVLCGVVAAYMLRADNFKEKYDTANSQRQAAQSRERAAEEELATVKGETTQTIEQLNNQISALDIQITTLQGKLDEAERAKSLMVQKVNEFAEIHRDFLAANTEQRKLLDKTLGDLTALEAAQTKQDRRLEEMAAEINDRSAIIAQLEQAKKQLIQDRNTLETRLNQSLRQYGQVAARPAPVMVPRPAVAQPAQPVAAANIGLSGRITALDLKNKLAEISIGTAQGVRQDMKFHVTRGNKFVCDILVLDVDSEKSVGILDLIQDQPRVGDSVSTNL